MGLIDGATSQIVSLQQTPQNYGPNNVKPVEATEATNSVTKEDEKIENLVAKSKDGDTLQEKEESLKALSEGMVLKKPQAIFGDEDEKTESKTFENLDAQKEFDQKKVEKEHVDSLIGYTKSQVEQLYREGRITKQEFDANMERREELEKSNQEKASVGEITKAALDNENKASRVEDLEKAFQNDRIDIASQIFNGEK